jgi:nucleotide-binding universal stress UspA family protein
MVTSLFRREAREGREVTATERRNILVAVAGNGMDEDLVRMACNLCLKGKMGKGRVIVINVVEVPRTLPLDAVVDNHANDRVLDAVIAVAQGMSVEIEAEVIQAREAGPAIVDEANDRDCRLIMLGLVPRSRFGQFDLGKTVPYVMEHAHGRVWVMRDEM